MVVWALLNFLFPIDIIGGGGGVTRGVSVLSLLNRAPDSLNIIALRLACLVKKVA